MNTKPTTPPAELGSPPCSADDIIVLEIKLPVPIKEIAAITDALCKIHGKGTLFMRQVGPMLQLYKLRTSRTTPKITHTHEREN